jgi:glucose-6-phosphate-specific signal transduction histidine kinase
MYVSEVNDAYRRENAILRTLLLEQGLSQRKLASELRKRQRTLQAKESSEQTLKRVVSEALDFLAKQDAAVLALLEDRIEDDHSKMH